MVSHLLLACIALIFLGVGLTPELHCACLQWSFATVELRDEQLFNALACHARANIANLEIQVKSINILRLGLKKLHLPLSFHTVLDSLLCQ